VKTMVMMTSPDLAPAIVGEEPEQVARGLKAAVLFRGGPQTATLPDGLKLLLTRVAGKWVLLCWRENATPDESEIECMRSAFGVCGSAATRHHNIMMLQWTCGEWDDLAVREVAG